MTYDNNNRGAIWKNDDKREDNHPDFKGSLNVNGVDYWVSAWKRKDGASANAPALSFTVKPKEEQPRAAQQSISQRAMPRRPAPDSRVSSGPQRQNIIPDDDIDDRIPF
ncbi:hypothetical protein [uncultured Bradyrhizobium sp.]|uniref:hypothetical protein n=1 Tax=uncultured Bradyrhizobium sp. TaxID=199684 RepID=UPI0035CC51CC